MSIEPVTGIATLIWSMISSLVSGYSQGQKGLFEAHVSPLQTELTLLHKDYISGFVSVRKALNEDAAPAEVIEFLKGRRRDRESERQLVRDLATELERSKTATRLSSGLREALREYCEAVVAYFSSGARVAGISWYSDL